MSVQKGESQRRHGRNVRHCRLLNAGEQAQTRRDEVHATGGGRPPALRKARVNPIHLPAGSQLSAELSCGAPSARCVSACSDWVTLVAGIMCRCLRRTSFVLVASPRQLFVLPCLGAAACSCLRGSAQGRTVLPIGEVRSWFPYGSNPLRPRRTNPNSPYNPGDATPRTPARGSSCSPAGLNPRTLCHGDRHRGWQDRRRGNDRRLVSAQRGAGGGAQAGGDGVRQAAGGAGQ